MYHCQNDLKTKKTYQNELTLSSDTLTFRLKESLASHSLPKYWLQKKQKSWNKMCDN